MEESFRKPVNYSLVYLLHQGFLNTIAPALAPRLRRMNDLKRGGEINSGVLTPIEQWPGFFVVGID
jgi:hypothetical protein